MVKFNPIDFQNRMAMYGGAQGVNAVSTRVPAPRTGATESGTIDSSAVLAVAAQNVQSRIGATSVKPANEVVSAPGNRYVGEQPEAQRVDSRQVTQTFGAQPTYKGVDKVKSQGALFTYMNAEKTGENSGYGQYDALKSFKSNQINQIQAVASTNPFTNLIASNGFDVTKGLSFAGTQNLDDKKMFIA